MQCACAILSSVACLDPQYYSTLSNNGKIFGGGGMNMKYVLIFFASFVKTFPILRRTEREMLKKVHRSSFKVPVILVRL